MNIVDWIVCGWFGMLLAAGIVGNRHQRKLNRIAEQNRLNRQMTKEGYVWPPKRDKWADE